jgi:hypothetical protein
MTAEVNGNVLSWLARVAPGRAVRCPGTELPTPGG